MESEELKILLALEPTWTVSCNGIEFQTIRSADISLDSAGTGIRIAKWNRRIVSIEWLRHNVVRITGRPKMRSKADTFTLYPGERLPSGPDLRRRRRTFQSELARALSEHFKTRSNIRSMLYSDRTHGIGGAYPRFIVGKRAVIAVDPDEDSPTVNAIMRAALLWSPMAKGKLTVVVPKFRAQTIQSRLAVMPRMRERFDWLEWDGECVAPLSTPGESVQSEVHEFALPAVSGETAAILASVPGLHPVLNIAAKSISIRFRGIEVAQIREGSTNFPLGEPLEQVVRELEAVRQPGNTHPLARAHQERWLESKLVGDIGRLLPPIDPTHIYPQVPSFVGEERNIIDLLTVTREGRLVVMEVKASADPDLPFQALDYWIAVERHRKAGDFQRKGYFPGVHLEDEPAVLVLVAPLLAFHKTLPQMIAVFPKEVPLLQIGLNQGWKREIKILRRQGLLS